MQINEINSNKKQKLLLEYLISSNDVYAMCSSILDPNYFDPELKKVAKFMDEYYGKYHTIPKPEQVGAETDVELTSHVLTKDQIQYCANEVEAFCKRRALEKAVLGAGPLIEKGDYGQVETLVKNAITVSLNRELGTQYFENPEDRILKRPVQRYSTGYKKMDRLLAGGFARKEIFLVSANSGGGKSITMANFGLNLMMQQLNVLYLTLELSEDLTSRRYDSLITGIPAVLWAQKSRDIITKIETLKSKLGKLVIKHMPAGTRTNDIRGYLKEFELQFGYVPDVIIVDYLDLMSPNERVSADNVFEKDKRSSEQLRDILFDYDMIGITASQQNRSAITAIELNQSHIAGGISKINTTDVYVSIILTDAMKNAGEIGFHFLKTRNSDGVGHQVYLGWNNKTLRIEEQEDDGDDDNAIKSRVGPSDTPDKGKKGLLDIIDT